LMARLEALSLGPMFAAERDRALRLALRPYFEFDGNAPLPPFAQEADLATLTIYADYYPQDGQLTLIEQLRDVVTEHIPEEERAWMDPLKHSYMDLVEVLPGSEATDTWACRSLGNSRPYHVQGGDVSHGLQNGQVLLTRFVQQPGDPETNEVVLAGSGLVLSPEEGRTLYDATCAMRRQREINAGSFELGDWHEYAKRFGYELLWVYSQMRLRALFTIVAGIQYCNLDGQPHLYALALYEHREFTFLRDTLTGMDGLEPDPATLAEAGAAGASVRWIQRGSVEAGQPGIVTRLTLTPTQLWVETGSRERMDVLKHQLASALGFSLHFLGETTAPPPHLLSAEELDAEQPVRVIVTPEQDAILLTAFLEAAYLQWSDRDSPVLGGKTPRHAATTPAGRDQVARVIDDMERHDLGWPRIGRPAFDYNVLRGHVGIDEVRREQAPAQRA
ncbi:MAG: hypothetical protein ABL970_14205, partial [Nitrospira sp.]